MTTATTRSVTEQKRIDRAMKTPDGRKEAVRAALSDDDRPYPRPDGWLTTWDIRGAVEKATGHRLSDGQIHGAMAKLGCSIERKRYTVSHTDYRLRDAA